jgi:hypothetical protein
MPGIQAEIPYIWDTDQVFFEMKKIIALIFGLYLFQTVQAQSTFGLQ